MSDTTDTIQDPAVLDDAALVAQREEWFNKSKTWMEPKRARWRKNLELYNGDIELVIPHNSVKVLFNIPLAVIETEMPVIADYLPSFDIMPTDKDDIEYADAMQKRKDQLAAMGKLKHATLQAIKDSLKYSDGLMRIMPKMAKGADGEERFRGYEAQALDVFTWFPSPDATGMELGKDCRYHIFATPMHVDIVFKQYRKKVEPEGLLDDFRSFSKDDGTQNDKNVDCVLLKECYAMDADSAKYPCGRYTVWANGMLLVDDPLWDGAEFADDEDYRPGMPVFKISNYGSHDTLFGIGETYLVRTQTQTLNEVMSACAETIKKTGNPARKVMKSWVAAFNKAIGGYAGENIEVNSMGDVVWDNPPSIPASTFQFVNLTMELTDVVTGVHDVMQGKNPTGITAASAIQALQEAAQARVRFKIAHEISRFTEDVGRFVVWLMKTYDRERTMIRDTDEAGQPVFVEYDPSIENTGRFDVEVVAGASIPTGRVATEAVATEKFEKGIYGIEEYAKMSSEPDKAGLVKAWYERQGLGQAKQRMGELQQAQQALGQLVQTMEEGSPEEDQVAQILQQFPELLGTPEFQGMIPATAERLLQVFVPREGQPQEQVDTEAAKG